MLPLMHETASDVVMPGLLLSNRETDTCYLSGKPHSQVQGIDGQWHDVLPLVWWVRSSPSNSHWQHTAGHVPNRQLPRCGRGGCLRPPLICAFCQPPGQHCKVGAVPDHLPPDYLCKADAYAQAAGLHNQVPISTSLRLTKPMHGRGRPERHRSADVAGDFLLLSAAIMYVLLCTYQLVHLLQC